MAICWDPIITCVRTTWSAHTHTHWALVTLSCVLYLNFHRMLLDGIDVNRFGSSITVYNANDGNVIVNTTSSLSDFYVAWNRTGYEQQASGLSLPAILRKLREIGSNMLAAPATTGKSFVSLIMPQMSNVNEADNNFAIQEVFILREIQPDLTLLFWSGGSLSRFQQYVTNESKDLFQLVTSQSSDSQQSQTYVFPVIQRIRSSKCYRDLCLTVRLMLNFLSINSQSRERSSIHAVQPIGTPIAGASISKINTLNRAAWITSDSIQTTSSNRRAEFKCKVPSNPIKLWYAPRAERKIPGNDRTFKMYIVS